MKRRNFLKSLVVTVVAPSVLKEIRPEQQSQCAYSENVLFCVPDFFPYMELELVVKCNKPIKVTLEESNDSMFCDYQICNPKNITKSYVRAKYEWIGSPAEVTTYLKYKDSLLRQGVALDYERKLTKA